MYVSNVTEEVNITKLLLISDVNNLGNRSLSLSLSHKHKHTPLLDPRGSALVRAQREISRD